jgi:hypothetical protein
MKNFIVAGLLVALCGAPSIAQAGINREGPAAVGEAPRVGLFEGAPAGAPPGEASDYAAREAAAPALGQFKGGDGAGIYIGGSALTVVLIVLLIVIIL